MASRLSFVAEKTKYLTEPISQQYSLTGWLQLVQKITSPGITNTAIKISATAKLTRKVFIKQLLKWLFLRRIRQVTPLPIIITPDNNPSNTKKVMSNHSSHPDFDADEFRAKVRLEFSI